MSLEDTAVVRFSNRGEQINSANKNCKIKSFSENFSFLFASFLHQSYIFLERMGETELSHDNFINSQLGLSKSLRSKDFEVEF